MLLYEQSYTCFFNIPHQFNVSLFSDLAFFFAPSLKNFTSDIFHDNIINNAVITKMHAID